MSSYIMTSRQQKLLASLPLSWKSPLEEACSLKEIDNLLIYLSARESLNIKIYPDKHNIFASLRSTSFEDVKVVIVGQDPYHGPGQAHGLSFSVPCGVPIPPSLKNIFKELKNDLGISATESGNLVRWANQGVLLLNSVLTVEDGSPASHAKRGWEVFTDNIIKALLLSNRPLVLMLWGAYAQNKIKNLHLYINTELHLALVSAHPSPFSVTGFFGCKHFSKANIFLKQHQLSEINW